MILVLITILINKKENFKLENQMIPKVIYLSYKTKNIPKYILDHWKNLNPSYDIKLYDNDDCKQFLLENYTQKYVDIFEFLKDGPIKADFWRLCILYKYGGVYADIDIELLVSIDHIINMEPNISFITCNSIGGGLNPHLIITIKELPLIKRCIEEYINKYDSGEIYSYWGYSITSIMYNEYKKEVESERVTEGINSDKRGRKYMIISEVGKIEELSKVYCSYKEERILNNRQKSYDASKHEFK